jgi:MOSC domain-containing protein YiiM
VGLLISVNAGTPRTVDGPRGRPVTTAIWKAPVEGRRAVRPHQLEGDVQADRTVHGGPDMAVYAYAEEDAAWWADQLGRPLPPGSFGENLTLRDVDVTGALLGERWQVGAAVLRVTAPRTPCAKLGLRMGDPRFPKRFGAAGRPGSYLAVEVAGEVGAGDAVDVLSRPDHDVTVGELALGSHHRDPAVAVRVAELPDLPRPWRRWAQRVLAPPRGAEASP